MNYSELETAELILVCGDLREIATGPGNDQVRARMWAEIEKADAELGRRQQG